MQLSRVEISNFRSIDRLSLEFLHGCQALIGINESGKSNILRALHLLDPSIAPTSADLRIDRHNEPQVTRGHIRFVFLLSIEEREQVLESMQAYFCTDSVGRALVKEDGVERSLEEWCMSRSEGLYVVEFPAGTRNFTTWGVRPTEKLMPDWFRNKTNAPIEILQDENSPVTIPARGFVQQREGLVLPEASFDKATINELIQLALKRIGEIVSAKLPKCLFWKYADQFLLPSSIDVATFCATPDVCIPLKSMFELAGYDPKELAGVITKAQAQGHYRYLQILEKTGEAATKHIRSVWNDYKSVRIRLEPNGPSLSPIVVDDEVPLDMENRSDGFKRFVSFLLQVSAKVRTSELRDCLILVDEPEIALHPTGARSLMRELIEIGQTNKVVYSTHSIFMIDKAEIGRHVVVEKKNEVTTTWRAEKSRIQDEEVLYSAIGYSIFESLKEHNVIFEGWRDKEIFRVVSEAMGKASKPIKDRLAAIGLTFAEGVKDIKNVAHFLQLASRQCVIISDADKPALQHRKAYQVPGAWGTWKTLQDIMPESLVLTGEDLVTREAIVKRANKFRTSFENEHLDALTVDFFDAGEATLPGLHRWLESSGLQGSQLDDALNQLKVAIFNGLKRAEISEQADELVNFVLNYDFT